MSFWQGHRAVMSGLRGHPGELDRLIDQLLFKLKSGLGIGTPSPDQHSLLVF
jgi:hypothetical protein